MDFQSVVYAGANAVREVIDAQTKANFEIWKAAETFMAAIPQATSFEDVLAAANKTLKAFTPAK